MIAAASLTQAAIAVAAAAATASTVATQGGCAAYVITAIVVAVVRIGITISDASVVAAVANVVGLAVGAIVRLL